jgi:preprotein translocase subunit SecY
MVFALVCVAALIIIVGVVFVEQGQRRIPCSTPSAWWAVACAAARRRICRSRSTRPVLAIPVIFASSLIYIPHLITQLIRSGTSSPGNSWWDRFVGNYLTNPPTRVHRHLLRADHLLHASTCRSRSTPTNVRTR